MNLAFLENNAFLSGGLVLMVVGGLCVWLRSLPGKLYYFVERLCFVKLEIQDSDDVFTWTKLWLSARLNKTLSVSAISEVVESDNPDEERTFSRPRVHLIPAVGTYFFWYEGKPVFLSRNREEKKISDLAAGPGRGGLNKESFNVRIFSRDRCIAQRFLEECRDFAVPEDDRLEIRVLAYHDWCIGVRIKPRSLDSVILDSNQAEELKTDLKDFLASRERYEQLGVRFSRGYLLHGPPGNGKSSVVKALAGEFKMHVYLLPLASSDLNDANINYMITKIPEKSIILIEDIDCVFAGRKTEGKNITFSGLLNAIDGVAAPEGRILIMTTNHVEKLDPALIRPGRCDMRLYFGNATQDQARRLFQRFFPDHAILATKFAAAIPDRKYSMASLQEHLTTYFKQPEQAICTASEIKVAPIRHVIHQHEGD